MSVMRDNFLTFYARAKATKSAESQNANSTLDRHIKFNDNIIKRCKCSRRSLLQMTRCMLEIKISSIALGNAPAIDVNLFKLSLPSTSFTTENL